MMNTRRSLLGSVAAVFASALMPLARAKPLPPAAALQVALESSGLIYLSPLHKSGKESRCHAEIWFVQKNGVVYVVTANTAWRAKAITRGLSGLRVVHEMRASDHFGHRTDILLGWSRRECP